MIRVKLVHPDAKEPVRNHELDAGLDLFSVERRVIYGRRRELIDTGVQMEIPAGMVGKIESRSKLASRFCIDVEAGVVDATYRGNVMVLLENNGLNPFVVEVGDKIAQMLIQPVSLYGCVVVDELDKTERGAEGINSTDMRSK